MINEIPLNLWEFSNRGLNGAIRSAASFTLNSLLHLSFHSLLERAVLIKKLSRLWEILDCFIVLMGFRSEFHRTWSSLSEYRRFSGGFL